MKHWLSLMLFVIVASSCNKPFFEGVIVYTIHTTYKGDNSRHKQFYETEKFGDTIRLYTNQEGFTKKEFVGAAHYGNKAYFYDPSFNQEFATYNFTDTVYVVNAKEVGVSDITISKCTGEQLSSVLGYKVGCLELVYQDPFLNLEPKSRYYYANNGLEINYTAWSHNMDLYQGSMYEESKNHWLRIEADYGNYEYVMNAIKIEKKEIPDEVFEIPDGPKKRVE